MIKLTSALCSTGLSSASSVGGGTATAVLRTALQNNFEVSGRSLCSESHFLTLDSEGLGKLHG